MAKKNKQDKMDKELNLLWKGIDESDFLSEDDNLIDEDVASFNKNAMIIFGQNVNLLRHLPRVVDSLKPVERRGLIALYENNAIPNNKQRKSSRIVADTMTRHPHSDASIYGTLAGMAQPWKNPVPLVEGIGNFGNDLHPQGYAHMRYTEMRMSKYAYECFFKDYDKDCIETIFNTSSDEYEPLALPSKFPNILINGAFGIAFGNALCIPTYNIEDIVRVTRKLIKDPNSNDIYILPDSPTGCDIVDNGTLRDICDSGEGTLRMRSTITVEEDPKRKNVWILRVHNLPWMSDIDKITASLTKLTRDGILPIKDIEDRSYSVKIKDPNGNASVRKRIKYDIIINRAHDPYQMIAKLYKLTQLEKSISVNFKVVVDGLTISKFNMKDLILAWISTSREYKRRRLNKKIGRINARISILEILIFLTEKENLEKTIKIIKSNTEENAIKALMKIKGIKINSYQASHIVDMRLRMFSKDAHARYVEEMKKLKIELAENLKKAKAPKLIDEDIILDLEDLLKYAEPRRSQIVSGETNVEIPNTDHFITVSKLGYIKKLPYDEKTMIRKKTPSLGVFKNQDYPLHGLVINNHDSLMLFDNFGRFSNVPVHEIDSTEPSQIGMSVYDAAKLNGEIVSAKQFFNDDTNRFINDELNATVYVVTLTKNGYLKKTPIEEYTSTRNQKNMRAMKVREDDEMVSGMIVLEREKNPCHILIYTKNGFFSYINSDEIALQSKDSSGLQSINLSPDDACKGMCIIGDKDDYLLVVTEKGNVKKCELSYLGQPGKRKITSYIATLDAGDSVCYVDGFGEDQTITVCTRTSYFTYTSEDIPTKARKSKCVKLIPVPLGNNIISVGIK